jgi:hypothetical protein
MEASGAADSVRDESADGSLSADAEEEPAEAAPEPAVAPDSPASPAQPPPVRTAVGNAIAGQLPHAERDEGGERAGPEMTRAAPAAREPLLIYEATLTLAVFDLEPALEAVDRLAREAGGYLVQRTNANITVRVPAKSFRASLDGVGKLGDELNRVVRAQDVTDEYADLEVRLRNAEVMRQRLEAILAKTGNISDALAVERELERVAQNIERIKGRLKLLSEIVAFSTITVNFEPRSVQRTNPKFELPFGWLQELGLDNLLSL